MIVQIPGAGHLTAFELRAWLERVNPRLHYAVNGGKVTAYCGRRSAAVTLKPVGPGTVEMSWAYATGFSVFMVIIGMVSGILIGLGLYLYYRVKTSFSFGKLQNELRIVLTTGQPAPVQFRAPIYQRSTFWHLLHGWSLILMVVGGFLTLAYLSAGFVDGILVGLAVALPGVGGFIAAGKRKPAPPPEPDAVAAYGGQALQGGYTDPAMAAGQAAYGASHGAQGAYAAQGAYSAQGAYAAQAAASGAQGAYAAQAAYGAQGAYAAQAAYGAQGAYAAQGAYGAQGAYAAQRTQADQA